MEDEVMRTDNELERDIREQLSWDYRIDSKDIQIHVTNGNAFITGTVPSDVVRVLVTHNIESVPGVMEVENQLAVNPAPLETVHKETETKIKQMLKEHDDIDSSHIKVSAIEEGFVLLEGETDTYWEKKRIEDIVTSFIGTVGVENRIAIIPKMKIADENIAQDIINNIIESEVVSLETVDIKVEDGKVTVTGSVPTWSAYNAIYESVVTTYGVRHINLNVDIEATF
jgi:osmotically-inducible protein OsmY